MAKNQTIIINADVIATLKGMDKVVTGLKSGLSEANTKIDFTKGIGASVSKLVDKFKNEFSKFNQLTENGKLDIGNTKEALKSGKNLIDTYKELQRTIGDLNSLTVVDAKKLFPDAFDQKVENASKKLKDFSNNWQKISEKQLKLDQAKTELQVLTDKLKELEKSLVDTNTLKVNTTSADQKVEEMTNKVKEFKSELKEELKLKVDTTDKDLTKNKKNRDNLQEKLNRANSTGNINTTGRSARYKGATLSEWEKGIGKASNASPQQKVGAIKAFQNYSNITNELDAVNKKIKEQEKELENFKTVWASFDDIADEKLGKELAKMGFSTDEIAQIQKAMNATNVAISEQTSARQKLAEAETENARIEKEMSKTNSGIAQKTQEIKQLEQVLENLQTKVGVKGLKKALKDALDIDISDDLLKSEQGLESLKNRLNELDNKSLSELIKNLSDMGINTEQAKQYVEQLTGTMVKLGDSAKDINRANQEMEQLKNQVLQFFSIGNGVQLFKRAVQSAIATVKELDATMTETATVTDFSVSDMWEQLPTYSTEATKLGAKINDLYAATTLYYQQGLNTNQSMAAGVETIKMARIAAMDATEATNLMTAALRGFNMEVNETNATRVNDVYSELAAITAADTQEIGVAMSKTASIANSANMEFETTAALLSQIIETTREAPETAGTAMKTIIARFTEMKKLYTEEQLTSGIDAEGEAFDINKIDTALKSVGMSLQGFMTGTQGIDDVLLELASKWDTLDISTQRYIATQAAGSRQQSRFLAMMSNYDRTMELVDAAYNSAGSSQEQFDKTLESLESKLNKLKNAWDQFTMGLANDEAIKFAVDVLTKILETINSIIDGISGGNGLVKSLVSLRLVVSTFKGIKKVLEGNIGKNLSENPLGSLFGKKDGKNALQVTKNTEKEAKQGGQKTGNAFVNGFKERIKNVKTNGLIKGLFTKNAGVELAKDADFSQIYNDLEKAQKKALQDNEQFKDSYLKSVQSINSQFSNSQLLNIQMEYDTNGIDAANAKIKEFGGNIQTTEQMANTASQTIETDFQAIANAAGMAGVAMMGIASLLESVGASEKVVGVIRSIGTALVVLPVIFKLVSAAAKVFSINVSASIMSIPIIGWIAAVISALTALIGIFSTFNETDSEKMEKLAKDTDKAKEAAEAATSAYNELKDRLSNLEKAQSTLDTLVYGTTAWEEALLDVNQQVLDLISLYPQLIDAVSQGEYGQLVLDPEKTNEIVKQISEGRKNAQQAQWIASAKESAGKLEIEKKNILTNIGTLNPTEPVQIQFPNQTDYTSHPISSEKAYDKMLQFAENPIEVANIENGEYSQELLNAAAEMQISAEEYAKFVQQINAFEQNSKIVEKQIQSSLSIALKTNLSDTAQNSKYLNQATQAAAEKYSSSINQDVENEVNSLTDKKNPGITELAKKLQGEGKNITSTNKDNILTYQEVYAALSGNSVEKIQEANYTKDDLVKLIAEIQTNNKYAESTEKAILTVEKIAHVSKSSADKTAAVLFNDFSSLTQEQIQELQKIDSGDALKQELVKWGALSADATEDEIKAFLDELGVADFDELANKINETAEGTLSQFSNIISQNFRTEEQQAKASDLITGKTYGETTSIVDALKTALGQGGNEAFNALSEVISTLNKADIDPDKYRIFLETLDDYDFSNPDQVKAFISAIKQIAPNLPIEQTEKWADNLIDAYGAVKTFSLENLRKELKSTLDLIDDLKERDNANFTDEEYQNLINSGANKEDFIWNGQDWTYIGGSLETLATAIESNTEALIKETMAITARKIRSGNEFNAGAVNLADGINDDYDADFIAGNFTDPEEIARMYSLMNLSSIKDTTTNEYLNIQDMLANGEGDRLVRLYKQQAEDAANVSLNEQKLAGASSTLAIAGKTSDEVRISGGNENEQLAAAITESTKSGLDANELISYRDTLINISKETDGVKELSKSMATEIARDNMMMNEAISELSENWDAWSNALKISNKGTPEYSSALSSLRNNMKNMLGITTDLSEDFLTNTENMTLMAKAAKGDVKAIEALRIAVAKNIVANFTINVDEEKKAEIYSLLDDLNGKNYEIGTTLDNDALITGLYDSALQAGATTKQIQDMFESIGWEPTFEKEVITLKDTDVSQGFVEVPSEIGPNGVPMGTRRIPLEASMSAGQTIEIPKIRGKSGSTVSATYKGNTSTTVSPSTKTSNDSGGSKQDTKTWKNPYDEYYNTTEKINELLRQRNKLESEFGKLASRSATTTEQLNKNLKSQLKNLEDQVKSQKVLINGKRKQLQNAADATMSVEQGKTVSFQQAFKKAGGSGSVTRYGKYNEATGQIEIDWAGLEALQAKDAEQGEAVEAYISYLEDISGELEDAQDALIDIEDGIIAIIDEQLEARNDLTTTLRDALIQQYQNEIDKLSELNDTINESNTNILNGIQESVDLSRQIRDNTETEQDIAEKEAKLAFLRRDTSGANDLEIKQLEEELKDARQSYSDTLVDQELDRLSKQNDDDAEARQKQIDLMQKQLDYWTESGYFNDQVNAMIEAVEGSPLANKAFNIWKEMQEYNAKTETEKIALMKEWNELWKKGRAGSTELAAADSMYKGEKYTLVDASGASYGGFSYDSATDTWSNGNISISGSDISSADTTRNTLSTQKDFSIKDTSSISPGNQPENSYPYGKASETSGNIRQGARGNAVKAIQYALNQLGFGNSGTKSVDGIFGSNTTKAVRAFQRAMGIRQDGIVGNKTREKFRAKQYKTGGLANYTGIAWLDGTKSKPELVLNAKDTENFITLKDILSDLFRTGTGRTKNSGDNYYDFHITVEQIANDYDVERMIQKVKDEINKDAIYRNVNSINFMR